MADIRAQTFNRDAQQSGDFVEFMGLAGLGQAEVSVLTRPYVDLDAGQIFPYAAAKCGLSSASAGTRVVPVGAFANSTFIVEAMLEVPYSQRRHQ